MSTYALAYAIMRCKRQSPLENNSQQTVSSISCNHMSVNVSCIISIRHETRTAGPKICPAHPAPGKTYGSQKNKTLWVQQKQQIHQSRNACQWLRVAW